MKQFVCGLLAAGSLIVFTACSGGSNGEETTIPDSSQAALSEATLPQVFDTVSVAFNMNIEAPVNINYIFAGASLGKHAKKTKHFAKITKTIPTVAMNETVNCSVSGSVTINGDDQNGTIIYNECKESEQYSTDEGYELVTNGTIEYQISGYSSYFKITNFTNTGNEVWNGQTWTWEYKYEFAEIEMNYTENADGTSISAGEMTMTGSFKENDKLVEYDTLKQTYKYTSIGSSLVYETNVGGFIKSNCLGGWIEIDTTKNVMMSYDYNPDNIVCEEYTDDQNQTYQQCSNEEENTCPSQGEIVIKGQGGSSVTINFNEDGSVDFSGSVTEHFDNCGDVSPGDGEDSCIY